MTGLPEGYELIRPLGHGAAGSVVLAKHTSLDRLVAIKTLHTGRYDTAASARLEREGRALVRLRHPNIVTVHELRSTDAGPALVMEYVDGGDLAADRAALSPTDLARIVGEIASALTHAHAAGVVHRDLKPANVLLTTDGHAKICDFGLARLTTDTATFRTATGTLTGTPAYLAPEQITDPAHENPASDTYAFAILVYELITSARPFAAESVTELLRAHLHDPPIPASHRRPDLNAEAERVLLAGLDKNPERRPSAGEIAEAVAAAFEGGERWLTTEPARTTRSSATSNPRLTVRRPRRRAIVVLVAIIVGALVGCLAVIVGWSR